MVGSGSESTLGGSATPLGTHVNAQLKMRPQTVIEIFPRKCAFLASVILAAPCYLSSTLRASSVDGFLVEFAHV